MPVLQTRSTEMPSKFRIGDRVEDNKTHKRGRVTFVYSEIERGGEVIEVLFNGRDEAVDVSVDTVRKISMRQLWVRARQYILECRRLKTACRKCET
jgi:hypothetical protein